MVDPVNVLLNFFHSNGNSNSSRSRFSCNVFCVVYFCQRSAKIIHLLHFRFWQRKSWADISLGLWNYDFEANRFFVCIISHGMHSKSSMNVHIWVIKCALLHTQNFSTSMSAFASIVICMDRVCVYVCAWKIVRWSQFHFTILRMLPLCVSMQYNTLMKWQNNLCDLICI